MFSTAIVKNQDSSCKREVEVHLFEHSSLHSLQKKKV